MRSVARVSAAVALLGAMAGCWNPFDGGDCTALGVYGITVYVVDAATTDVPAGMPTVWLTDGSYVESHPAPYPGSDPYQYSGALERPGRYDVTVEASGYQTVTRSDVRVSRGGSCDALRPVRLDIALTRL